MHRFFLPPEQCSGSTLTLAGREAHHGLHVLRLQRGEVVTVLDGAGREFVCEACEFGRESIHLAVTKQNFIPPLSYQVTLVQAVPKGKIFEDIVEKATELGAHRIVPLLTERVITHLDEESSGSKMEKWRLTAIEAIKQCGSAWLPKIEAPMTPAELLSRSEEFELSLIASLQTDSRHPREWFASFLAERHRMPQSVCVWVGPEGDFTPAELSAVQASGARPITLGRLVLRAATAAIYCLSVLNYELQFNPPSG